MDAPSASKFSIVGDDYMDESVYKELEKFVYYLAWGNNNPANVMMEADEIAGELLMELAKGLKAYSHLPHGEKVAVIKKMMDNRVFELRRRYYGTHRAAAKLTISLDTADVPNHDGAGEGLELTPDERYTNNPEPSPEEVMESMERVHETRDKLDVVAKRVFDAVVLGKNPRLTDILTLASIRANAVFSNPTLSLKPWHVAQALAISLDEAKQAFIDIRKAYIEVLNEKSG